MKITSKDAKSLSHESGSTDAGKRSVQKTMKREDLARSWFLFSSLGGGKSCSHDKLE